MLGINCVPYRGRQESRIAYHEEHIVHVHDMPHIVAISHTSKTVWVAIGTTWASGLRLWDQAQPTSSDAGPPHLVAPFALVAAKKSSADPLCARIILGIQQRKSLMRTRKSNAWI